jgi:hypothetical protein
MKAAMQKKPESPREEPKQEESLPVETAKEPVKEETPRAPEIDDIPLPRNKPKTGGEAPSWDEYMKQIQEEEAKNPTPVETKPAATRKPAVTKKAEPKPVDPEEEEKKKKR